MPYVPEKLSALANASSKLDVMQFEQNVGGL
jgi:hypothetical protein